MKNIIRIFLCALALGAPPSFLCAQTPTLPDRGRVLILCDSEKTMTGEIEREGDEYRVKRLVGETRMPASRVLMVCASLEEAHRFMQGRANLHDPDERLRLAEWCRQHNLRNQALEEVRAALALNANNSRAQRLLSYLERAKELSEQPATTVAESSAPRVDVTAESMGMFASKVQPILMNACVSCHNSGRGGNFQLTRTTGGLRNRKSLNENLSAVLNEINLHDISVSRLLLKSISIHAPGMAQAPLKNRSAPAYQTLEKWVKLTLETNPQLKEQSVASIPPTPVSVSPVKSTRWGADREEPQKTEARRTTTDNTDNSDKRNQKTEERSAPARAVPILPPKQVEKKEPPKEKEAPGPADPDAFNREFHPERKPMDG